MTTTSVTSSSPAPDAFEPVAPRTPHARLTGLAVTFPRVLKAEWIKLRTVRSNQITILAAFLAVIAFGALASAVTSGAVTPPDGGRPGGGFGSADDPTAVSLSGAMLAQLIVAVVGVLTITNEFGNGMIRTYFAAVPKRLPILWAKSIVVGVVVTVGGVIASFLAFFVGQAILGRGVTLGDEGVFRAVFSTGLYLGGIAVLGVAVGALLRHTAGSIAVLFASLLIVPQLLAAVLPDDWADAVTPYFPSNAGSAMMSVARSDTLLAPGAGAAVFAAWLVVLIGGAAWRMKRKDA